MMVEFFSCVGEPGWARGPTAVPSCGESWADRTGAETRTGGHASHQTNKQNLTRRDLDGI